MTSYAKHVGKNPADRAGMVVNSQGGYSFAVDDWTLLHRFLILGCEGGSYYATEKKMTQDTAQCVWRCAEADFDRTLNAVVNVSKLGRAPKNDPAIFALAMLASMKSPGSLQASHSKRALAYLNDVCRIGTHLFSFMESVKSMRGGGRSLRKAMANWYTERTPLQVAQQITKYQQRNGWSHRDVLRLARPTPKGDFDGLFGYATGKPWQDKIQDTAVKDYLLAVEEVKQTTDQERLLQLIEQYRLPWEVLPTEALTSPAIWESLLPHMGITAMLRNLGRLSKLDLFKNQDVRQLVLSKFADTAKLREQRVHPFSLLLGLTTYQEGHGVRGSMVWKPDAQVVKAVEDAFYASFGAIPVNGTRYLLGLDVSGSMGAETIANTHITAREASAVMAMTQFRVEENVTMMAFQHQFTELKLKRSMNLDTVVKKISDLPFGGTDCSLPMEYAMKHNLKVDAFVVYTDSETGYSRKTPKRALEEYRQKTGIPAKLIVVGFVANGFSIADPSDAGMLDIVGFDAAAPEVMTNFITAGFGGQGI